MRQSNDPALFVSTPATRLSFTGDAACLQRAVPVETPVEVVYSPTPYAVMMASPGDLEDFAYGFSLSEGVIETATDIRAVQIETKAGGVRVEISLVADKLKHQLARSRNLVGRTGCGVCGVTDIAALPFAAVRAHVSNPLKLSAVRRAVLELDAKTPLGDLTRATHAAAWCSSVGEILLVREDVGRHNALDKLIGAAMRARLDATAGFVLITSRCSFEMVEKAAAFGAAALVAVSAPTSLALERARAHGMTLVAIARRDGALLFETSGGLDNDLQLTGARSA